MTHIPSSAGFQLLEPKCKSLRAILGVLDHAESMDEVVGQFARFPTEFGFDWASIVILNSGSQRLVRQRVLTNMPNHARSFFAQKKSVSRHPLIHNTILTKRPVFFEKDPTLTGNNLKNELAPAPTRNKSGVTFLVEQPSGLKAAVLLHTGKSSPWNERQFSSFENQIYGVAEQFLDAFVYFGSIGFPKEKSLTNEEVRFLRLLATVDDPKRAKHADYSFGTAENLQRSIACKLGVKSIFQAVAISAKRGLIDPDYYGKEEILHTGGYIAGWHEF